MTEDFKKIYTLRVELDTGDGSVLYRWYMGVQLPERIYVFTLEEPDAFPLSKARAELLARNLWFASARNFRFCTLKSITIDLHVAEKERKYGIKHKGE